MPKQYLFGIVLEIILDLLKHFHVVSEHLNTLFDYPYTEQGSH